MSIVERDVRVTMARDDLLGIPRHAVPAGYLIRPYARGDERVWAEIQWATGTYDEIAAGLFRDQFGDDAGELGRRLFMLEDAGGGAVGTAAAWLTDRHHDARYGRVHWLAVHPAHQRRGLAKALLSHVCITLRELGHERAFLDTSSGRVPAITLYLRFGFAPEFLQPEDAAAWAELERHLPDLARHRRGSRGRPVQRP